jgi:hypothetical protein
MRYYIVVTESHDKERVLGLWKKREAAEKVVEEEYSRALILFKDENIKIDNKDSGLFRGDKGELKMSVVIEDVEGENRWGRYFRTFILEVESWH